MFGEWCLIWYDDIEATNSYRSLSGKVGSTASWLRRSSYTPDTTQLVVARPGHHRGPIFHSEPSSGLISLAKWF